MKPKSVALLIAGFFSEVAHLPAQVIPNPSFESSTGLGTSQGFIPVLAPSAAITGWTVGGNTGVDYFNALGATPADGNFFIDLVRGPGQGGAISTTITGLTPGAAYLVAFEYQTASIEMGTRVTITIDGNSQTFGASTVNVWETHSMSFTAGTSTAALSFAGPVSGAVDSDVFVDNVTISAIPEP